jgi:hypothetical protein
MKVNKKNNRLMWHLTLASITAVLFAFVLEFNYTPSFILHSFTAVVAVFLIWYLIGILQLAGEAPSIQTPFSILLGISIISVFSNVLFIGTQSTGAFGILNAILVVYVMLATFKIKNPEYSGPFRFLGVALVVATGFKLSAIFFIGTGNLPVYVKFVSILDILPLVAILMIINKAGKNLHNDTAPASNDQLTA